MAKIAKVEIKSLWRRYDLIWDLNLDVNILAGINGCGKSTILRCIYYALQGNMFLSSETKNEVRLSSDNGRLENNIPLVASIKITLDNNTSLITTQTEWEKDPNFVFPDIDYINTFDKAIPDIGKPDKVVQTELDRDIFRLQKSYLDYQLNIGKRIFDNPDASPKHILEVRQRQNRFQEIMDNLFEETGKKIDRNNNEIAFINGKEALSVYQLSSGEKQLLVILLTVLVQDDKESIIIMDEPEISLHFDWQKKLIQYMQELNPNLQIILATHSPAMIIEGWRDKIFNVTDLIINLTNA